MFARNQSVPRLVSLSPIMKRIVLNRLGTLVVVSVLNLQLSTALAQDAAFTPLTITNPTPTGSGFFASATAAAGTDRVLLGARGDDIGASSAGAVYLFSLEPLAPGVPSLTLQLLATNSVAVSWPSPSSG